MMVVAIVQAEPDLMKEGYGERAHTVLICFGSVVGT